MDGNPFHVGDRVVINRPLVGDKPNPWHGRHGVVAREPGDLMNGEHRDISTNYAVLMDGDIYAGAPHYADGLLHEDQAP